jgi:hypothetical protein
MRAAIMLNTATVAGRLLEIDATPHPDQVCRTWLHLPRHTCVLLIACDAEVTLNVQVFADVSRYFEALSQAGRKSPVGEE